MVVPSCRKLLTTCACERDGQTPCHTRERPRPAHLQAREETLDALLADRLSPDVKHAAVDPATIGCPPLLASLGERQRVGDDRGCESRSVALLRITDASAPRDEAMAEVRKVCDGVGLSR
jgi:hypothetical protein